MSEESAGVSTGSSSGPAPEKVEGSALDRKAPPPEGEVPGRNDVPARSADLDGHPGPGGRRRLSRRAWLGVLAGGFAVPGLGAYAWSRYRDSRPVTPGPDQCAPAGPEPDAPANATVEAEQWLAGGRQAWRTDTGVRLGASIFTEDMVFAMRFTHAYDPFDHGWCCGFDDAPYLVFEGQDLTVLTYATAVVGLGTRDGAIRWSTVLAPQSSTQSSTLVVGGVAAGRVWTTAGLIELATGEVRALPASLTEAWDLSVSRDKRTVHALVRTDENDGGGSDLVAIDPHACGELWRISGVEKLRHHDDHETLVVGDDLIDPRTGRRTGSTPRFPIIVDPWAPGPTEGLFTGVSSPKDEATNLSRVVVLLDDDGGSVTVRALENHQWTFTSPYSQVDAAKARSATAAWEVPTELRPGAVYSWPSRVERTSQGCAAAFWVLDLDDGGGIHLSRWEPGPA